MFRKRAEHGGSLACRGTWSGRAVWLEAMGRASRLTLLPRTLQEVDLSAAIRNAAEMAQPSFERARLNVENELRIRIPAPRSGFARPSRAS